MPRDELLNWISVLILTLTLATYALLVTR